MASLPAKLWKNAPNLRWTLKWLSILLVTYVVSYLPRSLWGTYGWGAVGISHVKSWHWYPKGCGFGTKTGQLLHSFYSPLIWLDSVVWHNEEFPEFKRGSTFHGWPP